MKWRAQILDNQGQSENALNAYQDALDTNGSDPILQRNLGLILFQLNDYSRPEPIWKTFTGTIRLAL